MNKPSKEKRKQLLNDLQNKTNLEFERSLPMNRQTFTDLFDYLDIELAKKGCDNTNSLTKTFLNNLEGVNANKVLEWLSDKGGYCDCEILANVEDQFDVGKKF